jgi:hypothetical protein
MITDDGTRIIYSHTDSAYVFVDDGHTANDDGTDIINITDSYSIWEEHLPYLSSGDSYVYISSVIDQSWNYHTNSSTPKSLFTELFIVREGETKQLTRFNEDAGFNIRVLTSDFDWDKTGEWIAIQVQRVKGDGTGEQIPPEIWMIEFPEPQ